MKDHVRIVGKLANGDSRVLTAWVEDGEIFIRESIHRGRDVQTVAITAKELDKINALARVCRIAEEVSA